MKESDIVFGFGDPPVPTYIYVGDSGDPNCPWYQLDYQNNNKKMPIAQKALTGKLVGLKLVKKTHKDKPAIKLDISIQADKRYVIRSGVETYFTRSFVLAASMLDMFEEPIILAAIPGTDQSVVFCKLYYAINAERIKIQWDANCKLHPLINALQQRMNIHPQTLEEVMSGEDHKDTDDDLSPVDRMIKEEGVPVAQQTTQPEPPPPAQEEPPQVQEAPPPEVLTGSEAAEAEAALQNAKPVEAVKEPEAKVQVPNNQRVPAPIAVSRRTMGPEYYATEIDDVINVSQLGKLRGLAEQLNMTDEAFCLEVMGCEPSDLSVKGADHLIHFAEVKVKGDDQPKK